MNNIREGHVSSFFYKEVCMKKLLLICLVSLSFSSFAKMTLEQKVKILEKKIERMQKANGAKLDSSSGLKVKDLAQDKMQTGVSGSRGVAGVGAGGQMPAMTKEQQEEMMKTIELFKERQIESQKILDELMKEP